MPLARIGGGFRLCSFTESHPDGLVVQPPLVLGEVVQHPLVRVSEVADHEPAGVEPAIFYRVQLGAGTIVRAFNQPGT